MVLLSEDPNPRATGHLSTSASIGGMNTGPIALKQLEGLLSETDCLDGTAIWYVQATVSILRSVGCPAGYLTITNSSAPR